MKPVDRRTFMKGMAAVSAAAVGSAVVPGEVLPSTPQRGADFGPVWGKSPCLLCEVGCGLLIGVQSRRAGAVKGDPDSPSGRGLACAKGYYSVQALYGADRLDRALVRRGISQVSVPTAEALDLVARRIREVSRQSGADSVAVYGGRHWTPLDAHVAAKLFGAGIGSPHVWSERSILGAAAAAGLRTTFARSRPLASYADIDQADVFVLWDINLAETHPVLFSRMLERRRRDRTVRIIDLTTRTTRTSYAADETLLHQPLSLLAVANAACAELVTRGQVDQGFVERHVAFNRNDRDGTLNASFDEFAAFVRDYSPARAQQLSGVPPDRIRWLASLYGDPSRKVMSVWGANVNHQTNGTATNNAIYNLHLLTGKIATPGNTALALDHSPGGMPGDAEAGAVPSMQRALDDGRVRMLWIQGSNPGNDLPILGDRLSTPAAGRFLVVSDAYPSATTRVADVVLPSALWCEREEIRVNAGRCLQHNAALVDPPGDAADLGWQMLEVARRLGLSRLFPWERAKIADLAWEEIRAAEGNSVPGLPAMARLRAGGVFQIPGDWDGRASIWIRPYAAPVESPDSEFPFWLNVGAVIEHSGSGALTRRIPTLHRGAPQSYVEMNREDAGRLGIRTGDMVRLVSRRGTLVLRARVDYRSQPQPGMLFVPWFDDALTVTRLMPAALDPLSGQPHSTACAVRMEGLGPGGGT